MRKFEELIADPSFLAHLRFAFKSSYDISWQRAEVHDTLMLIAVVPPRKRGTTISVGTLKQLDVVVNPTMPSSMPAGAKVFFTSHIWTGIPNLITFAYFDG